VGLRGQKAFQPSCVVQIPRRFMIESAATGSFDYSVFRFAKDASAQDDRVW
jgi:hypothetical protein